MAKQVANNKEEQLQATIIRTATTPTVTITHKNNPGLIKQQYTPIGETLTFPKAWGHKQGATKLLTDIIHQQQTIIKNAQAYITELQSILANVEQWPDNK